MSSKNLAEIVNQQPERSRDETGWLPALGFAFLTYNSVTAVYRSAGDPWTVGFVTVSYLALLLLFWCLRRLDKTPEDEEDSCNSSAGTRGKLKAGVWFLASLLTLMFSYKVADIMPWPAAVVIWAMSATTVCGGFWGFFIHRSEMSTGRKHDQENGVKSSQDLGGGRWKQILTL